MDVCHQVAVELRSVFVEAKIIQQVVLEQHGVKLAAVLGPHFVLCEVRNCKNTTSEGGGGTSKGGHSVGARKNVCVSLLLLLESITCTPVQTGRFLVATGYVAPSIRP